MITSLDAENAFDKVQHPFIGTWGNLGTQGTYFNITKICRKPKANVWLIEKKKKKLNKTKYFKILTLIKKKDMYVYSPFLLRTVLDFLDEQ